LKPLGFQLRVEDIAIAKTGRGETGPDIRTETAFADTGGQLRRSLGLSLALNFSAAILSRRFSDGGHGFNLEFVRDLEIGPGAVVVEAFHAMDDEALAEALQRKISRPRRNRRNE